MDSIPLINATQLKPFTDLLQQIGSPVNRYLRQVNLPSHILETPEAIIPERPLWHLAELATHKEDINGFGFLCGKSGVIEELGQIESWLRQSPTLYHALITFCALVEEISSHAKFWLLRKKNETWFCREGIESINVGRWPVEQYTLIIMLQLIRLGAGEKWMPEKVFLQTEQIAGMDETDVLNKAQIHIGQPYTAIAIPHLILYQPLKFKNKAGAGISLSEKESKQDIYCLDYYESIRQVVKTYLHGKAPEIKMVASAMGFSVRTLQRHLGNAGMTYSGLVQGMRYETAVSLLKEHQLKLLDIAYELGYSDPAHFSRAFQRMAGISPREYRNQQYLEIQN